jgi:hypothetical protein
MEGDCSVTTECNQEEQVPATEQEQFEMKRKELIQLDKKRAEELNELYIKIQPHYKEQLTILKDAQKKALDNYNYEAFSKISEMIMHYYAAIIGNEI